MQKRIIDKRKKEKFMMDDEYLNGMAKLCGWQGTIVYNSLCRHANIDQESFPSIKLIAEQHSVSRPTIFKGIDLLEKRNVIKIKKTRTKDGKWLNNIYILLDKSEWKYSQVNQIDTASQVNVGTQPSQRRLPDVVNVVDTKETHSEGNTYKETHTLAEQSSALIVEIIKEFESVDLKNKTYYGNKTQRGACDFLIESYGYENVISVIKLLPKTNTMEFMPTVTTPVQLRDKWVQLSSGIQRIKEKKIKNITNVIV